MLDTLDRIRSGSHPGPPSQAQGAGSGQVLGRTWDQPQSTTWGQRYALTHSTRPTREQVSQREICTIVQPCILCEADQEVWHVYMDEETSVEEIIVEELEHTCPGMKRIMAKRVKSPTWD